MEIRVLGSGDLDAAGALVVAAHTHDVPVHTDPAGVLAGFREVAGQPGLAGWIVTDGAEAIGYAAVVPVVGGAFLDPYGGVAPGHRRRGVGAMLLDAAELHARELDGCRRLRGTVSGTNAGAAALFLGRGYSEIERSWELSVELGERPPVPRWPGGITVRTFRSGDEHELYELIQETFGDNEGYDRSTRSFQLWASGMLPPPDPGLYLLAERSGRLVGAALAKAYPDGGWINQLGVRREERGRGLGRALLHEAFSRVHAHGHRVVGLTVDSWNTTGARSVYESVGMREVVEYTRYALEL